jgi:hypothetical protein
MARVLSAQICMSVYCRTLLLSLVASASCLANSPGHRLPTFGLYIVGNADTNVLEMVMPALYRLDFAASPREASAEQLSVSIFRNPDDDELQALVGRGCVLLEFNGWMSLGADPEIVVGRFKRLHDALEQYLSALPEPRPRFLTTLPIPEGCPVNNPPRGSVMRGSLKPQSRRWRTSGS